MKIYVVSLDLRHPVQFYQPLYNQLEGLRFQRLQPTLWAGSCDASPEALKASVIGSLQPEDGVFVFSQESEFDDYASHNPVR
jgi:hypothetical protein